VRREEVGGFGFRLASRIRHNNQPRRARTGSKKSLTQDAPERRSEESFVDKPCSVRKLLQPRFSTTSQIADPSSCRFSVRWCTSESRSKKFTTILKLDEAAFQREEAGHSLIR
jgi:hypothetical protein